MEEPEILQISPDLSLSENATSYTGWEHEHLSLEKLKLLER